MLCRSTKMNVYLIILLIGVIIYYTTIQSGKEGYGVGDFINNFQSISGIITRANSLMTQQEKKMYKAYKSM